MQMILKGQEMYSRSMQPAPSCKQNWNFQLILRKTKL